MFSTWARAAGALEALGEALGVATVLDLGLLGASEIKMNAVNGLHSVGEEYEKKQRAQNASFSSALNDWKSRRKALKVFGEG